MNKSNSNRTSFDIDFKQNNCLIRKKPIYFDFFLFEIKNISRILSIYGLCKSKSSSNLVVAISFNSSMDIKLYFNATPL